MPPPDGHITNAPPSPDAELVEAYFEHHAWLERFLARRFGRDAAQDLTQDLYVEVHDYRPPRPVRRPRSLLVRIALNLAGKRWRKASREMIIDPADPLMTDRAGAAEQEEAVAFSEMLLDLSPKLRDVFVLNHVMGLTHGEIARLRGISVKAVEKRMAKAIAECVKAVRT